MTAPAIDAPNGIPLPGYSLLDERRFITGLRVAQLPNVFLNPYIAESPTLLEAIPLARKFAERRELVQRLMKTQARKKKNVASYRDYIRQVIHGERMGSMPPIEGWTPEIIRVEGNVAYLPWGEQLVAFDSDTQLCGLFDLLGTGDERVLNYVVPVVIHSGQSVEWAQQQLHDRNTFGVKMTSSEALVRDAYDDVTALARKVIAATGIRVAYQARQLGARDKEQITLSALRQGVLTTVAGRPGIQYGSKPFEIPPSASRDAIETAVVAVWSEILKVIEPYLTSEGRKATVLPAPSVMAGLGVIAHMAMPDDLRRPEVAPMTVEAVRGHIEDVRWDRVATTDGGLVFPWDGIAGKANQAQQRFAVGGAKEYAYAVADALENPATERGQQIR